MTALKLFLSSRSSRAIASLFCSDTERPGLLGQLILATVATQAARNSRSAEGVRPDGSPVPVFFCATHPAMTIAISAANTLNSDFPAIVIMVLIVG